VKHWTQFLLCAACLGPLAAAQTATEKAIVDADAIESQAIRLYRAGRYTDAEPLFLRALKRKEQTLGSNHVKVAASLSNLAALYYAMGQYEVAEPLSRRSLGIREQTLGPNHPDTALGLQNLATTLLELAEYDEAEELYRNALAVRRKKLGENDPATAETMGSLGRLYHLTGNYESAEDLLRRAVGIQQRVLGAEHPGATRMQNNLALLLADLGDSAAAEPIFRHVLKTREKTFGPRHPDTATSLNNLALLYHLNRDFETAVPLYQRALEIVNASFGEVNPITASYVMNLGGLYYDMGRDDRAERCYRRALEVMEKTLGEAHPNTATVLLNLASLLERRGDIDAAEKCHRRAIEILENVFGPHPLTASALDNYACYLVGQGRPPEGLEAMRRAEVMWAAHRARVFAFATEREQFALFSLPESRRGGMNIALSLVAEHLPEDADAQRFALSVVLAQKGLILETLASRRASLLRSDDPAVRRLFEEWHQTGRALMRVEMNAPAPGQAKERANRLTELTRRKQSVERDLARASARFAAQQRASQVTLADVARALPADAALVEFVRYRSFRFRAQETNAWAGNNYVALILPGGTSPEPEPVLVRLGDAETIDAAIRTWRTAVGPGERGRISERASVEAAGTALAKKIWEPIMPALGGRRRVCLAPDGELAFVSFGALPGREPGRFLIEEFDLGYVATGRDLVRETTGQAGAPVLVGSPEFGPLPAGGIIRVSSARLGIGDPAASFRLAFDPLPNTKEEVESIRTRLRERKQEPVLLTGTSATEAGVKSLKRPALLHLATHGFFLPDTQIDARLLDAGLRGVGGARPQSVPGGASPGAAKAWREIQLRNPMHRSGVALTAANDTLAGRREAGGDDGLLTAEEVAGMDLWGTRCVVISACESGLGEDTGSEGVFGLRRAFTLAGAQSLVMSLWSVPDQPTRELMESLYRHLENDRAAFRALLLAQREWIARERAAERYPHPFHWAAFIASGAGTDRPR